MKIKEKIQRAQEKPFRTVCLEGDYSASFTTSDEAYDAMLRHQNRYPRHEVIVTETTFLENNN